MNSKELKPQKKVKKNKASLKNGGQQVFVLPPNLLQKLGINLGNMGSSPISPDMEGKINSCVSNHTHEQTSKNSDQEINSNVDNESSITKTANLMKESVFLSPTFNTVNLNNDSNSKIEKYVEGCNTDINYSIDKIQEDPDEKCNPCNIFLEVDLLNKQKLKDDQDHNNFSNNQMLQLNGSTTSDKCVLINETKNYSDNNIISEETASVTKFKEYYKKLEDNCNDNNLSTETNTLETNISRNPDKFRLKNDTKKVINIISEETVTVAKLNQLKVLHLPPQNTIVPASLDTIIGKNIKKDLITQFQTKPTVTMDIVKSINLVYNASDDKLLRPETVVAKPENIINMDSNIYCNTENNNNPDNIEYHIFNNKELDIEAQPVLTELENSFDNETSQVILSDTSNRESSEKDLTVSPLHFSPSQNNVSVIDEIIDEESKSTDLDLMEDKKISSVKNLSQEHSSNDGNTLFDNQSNIVKQIQDSESEVILMDDYTQNTVWYLPVNSNNNSICDDNNSNANQNKVQMQNVVDNDLQNIKTNSLANNHNNTSIEDSSEKCSLVLLDTNKNTSVDEEKISEEIVNDNITLTNCLVSVENNSNTTVDGRITKLSLPLNPTRNNFISKLCIQGVEKPGGFSRDTHQSLKTYSNNKKHNKCEKYFTSEDIIVEVKVDDNSNIDFIETSINNLFPCQQFCTCSDYGILDYNQFDNSYEHIHFTTKQPLDCNPDIIFSIYENETINIEEKRDIDYIEDNTNEAETAQSEFSICWYNADSNQTNFEDSQEQDEVIYTNYQISENMVQNAFKNVHNNSNASNIDYQNQLYTIHNSKHNIEFKSSLNTLPKIKELEVKPEADGNSSTKNDISKTITLDLQNESRNKNNKLDFQTLSWKRKISHHNDDDEMTDNKKVKVALANEMNIVKPVETREIYQVTDQGFKGWKINDNIVQEVVPNVANKQHLVKCAVCGIDVVNAEWSIHIASHDYIAWKEDDPPVNLEDEDAIRDHLHNVVLKLGHLECNNCGLRRKYAKPFLQHIKSCYSSSDVNGDGQVPYHLSKLREVDTDIVCDRCGYKTRNSKEHLIHMKKCIRKSGHCTRYSNESVNAQSSANVVCGVCKVEVTAQEWITHIQSEHNYQAWREGDTPLNVQDKDSVWKHLYMILQEHGALVCSKCSKPRKYVKLFLRHIESCTGPQEQNSIIDESYAELESVLETSLDDTGIESTKLVKCGLCHLEMESKNWIDHIQEKHNYLSWQEGKTPLNTQDDEVVRRYLYVLVQKLGSLACAKCGVARRYVKSYLSHVQSCKGTLDKDANNTDNLSLNAKLSSEVDTSMNVDTTTHQLNSSIKSPTIKPVDQPDTIVKCGVCQREMGLSNWISHINMSHEYIAWKETETPIDVNNYEAIVRHLTQVVENIGALKCADCGKKCKYVNSYLSHIKACYGKIYVTNDGENSTLDDSASNVDTSWDTTCVDEEDNDTRMVKCGVCNEEMQAQHWIDHIHKQHNYLAWQEGDMALNLENNALIRSHLKSIVRKIGRLTCVKCGLQRRKVIPFYTHIKNCDGTAELFDKPIKTLKRKLERSEKIVECAVCTFKVADSLWIDHIAKEHDYMAWQCGDVPLNVVDEISVKDHLYKITQTAGELICNKCGQSRKYVKSYLQHRKGCAGLQESTKGTFKIPKINCESSEMVTCALCRDEMADSVWLEHIAEEHNYVSWKQNDPPLEFKDEKSLRDHLYNIVQSIGSLVCSKCGLVRKYAKSYLQHIETCQKVTLESINKIIQSTKGEGYIVRCAVCGADVHDIQWRKHIASQHNYIAWRECDPALDINDEDGVLRHLKKILHEEGYLKCPKCKVHRKYAKTYLQHVNNCDGTEEENIEINDTMNESEIASDDFELDISDGTISVNCGVCAQEVSRADWLAHIQKKHNYLAWREGKEPIDLTDKDAVYNHLNAINVKCKGLTCASCGVVRRYVKAYLHHVQDCNGRNYGECDEIIECGVCGEKMVGKLWKEHAMQVHYNIAWVAGDTPLDVRNFFGVDKYLKEYHEYKHKLVCNICGLTRASLAGFYAHILICGKTDEEIDKWKDVCDICNQKYLCIYKTQHYWAHRVQEVAKERKVQDTLKKKESLKEDNSNASGRRRAAEKARSVIGDYAAKISYNKCKSCNYETESKEELANHRCKKRALNSNEDSDDSISLKMEDFSDEESEDTDVDSEVSNEEEETAVLTGMKKRIKNETSGSKVTTKCSKFPFEVKDARPYLQESKHEHFELYNMRETLFTHWRDCNYDVVEDEMLPQYMPQLEESCKVSISNDGWTTYKRFESRKAHGCKVLFTGGSIQCIAWAPEHPESTSTCHSLLAVATHRGPDCPRLRCTDTLSHPALIQIWDFETFKSLPKLAFGLAHNYGTVWAMDWCPSGARDIANSDESDNNTCPRLGLLAIACSNGSAYIIPVPYPDKQRTSEITFYKIRPCAELRVTRGNSKYQATSINWSLFKGYTTISVGYGDGTVALYDLVSESPLLTANEGDINIIYPYQDERIHNSCVTGLTSCVLGAWCSSSPTGSTAGVAGTEPRAGRGARPLRTHSALAASAATFMPHWPNVILSGDDTIVGLSPSELEWGYVGRRVGSLRALAPCVHRARVAAVVPPLLQAMRPHPAAFKGHKTIHKKNVAMIEMTRLAKKRSKHSNDELSMKVEPITYEEAIASYGIEFKFERDFDKAFVNRIQQKQRVPFPERFPLADVPAVAYCPASAHYTKLAFATHSGLLLLFDV